MRIEIAVSLLALLISLLSAVYARRSVLQAKQANRIALHDRKLEVLNAFRQFRTALHTSGQDFEAADLFPLLNAPEKAKLYFEPALVAELKQYSAAGYELLHARDWARRYHSIGKDVPQERWEQIFGIVDRCHELEKDLAERLEAAVQVVHV